MGNDKDLSSGDGVKLLVDSFYEKVNQDDLLSPIFNEFADVNWESHLPRMYEFWDTILFYKGSYKGSPFPKHVPLPIEKMHFDRWISLFNSTVDEHFKGEMADEAKLRALSIATVFQSKISQLGKLN